MNIEQPPVHVKFPVIIEYVVGGVEVPVVERKIHEHGCSWPTLEFIDICQRIIAISIDFRFSDARRREPDQDAVVGVQFCGDDGGQSVDGFVASSGVLGVSCNAGCGRTPPDRIFAAAVVRAYLRTPYNRRRMAVYEREFIDRYVPGKSFYLNEDIRRRLHDARSPIVNPATSRNLRGYIDGLIGVYEINNVSLLREIYVDAYLASAENYSVLRAELESPSKAALVYRDFVRRAVRRNVLEWKEFRRRDTATMAAEAGIPDADREQVIDYIGNEVRSLHEGNAIRYRLSVDDLASMRRDDNRGTPGATEPLS